MAPALRQKVTVLGSCINLVAILLSHEIHEFGKFVGFVAFSKVKTPRKIDLSDLI